MKDSAATLTRSEARVCSVCGYGIALPKPPPHCPMCRTDDAWVPLRRRS